MMYAGRILFAIATVVASVGALPNHLKAVVVDPEPVGTSVSASFGPYSAKAGLGGSGSGGGLFAAADSPQGSASTGLGGGVTGGGLGASASTGDVGASGSTAGHSPTIITTGGKPGHYQPGLFDGIFNIPISVLQAVNTYLNNRGPITKPVHPPPHRRRVHEPQPPVYKTVIPEQAGAETPAPEVGDRTGASDDGTQASAASSADASATAGSGVAAGTHPGQRPVYVQKRVNYDDIFAIPISALKSVNQLLNGKK